MIYAYVIRKNKGHHGHSPVLRLLNHYCLRYGSNDFVLSLPGYLGTTQKTINKFTNYFPRTAGKKRGYFFEGMNGRQLLPAIAISRQEYINSKYGAFVSSINTNKDHSKVAAFLDMTGHIILKQNNIDQFINTAKVNAILLGSSNQSYTTYINSPADKGEADVFLVDENVFPSSNRDDEAKKLRHFDDNQNRSLDINFDIVVTKQIDGDCDLRAMLDKILKP